MLQKKLVSKGAPGLCVVAVTIGSACGGLGSDHVATGAGGSATAGGSSAHTGGTHEAAGGAGAPNGGRDATGGGAGTGGSAASGSGGDGDDGGSGGGVGPSGGTMPFSANRPYERFAIARPGDDVPSDIAPTPDGFVVIGSATERMDGSKAGGDVDVYLTHYDRRGEQTSAIDLEGGSDYGSFVVSDPTGDLLIAGEAGGPLAGTAGTASDAFVGRLLSSGEFAWLKRFGANGWNQPVDLQLAPNGDVAATLRIDQQLWWKRWDADGDLISDIALSNLGALSDGRVRVTSNARVFFAGPPLDGGGTRVLELDAAGTVLRSRDLPYGDRCSLTRLELGADDRLLVLQTEYPQDHFAPYLPLASRLTILDQEMNTIATHELRIGDFSQFNDVAVGSDGAIALAGGTYAPDAADPTSLQMATSVIDRISPEGEHLGRFEASGDGVFDLSHVAILSDGAAVAIGWTLDQHGSLGGGGLIVQKF